MEKVDKTSKEKPQKNLPIQIFYATRTHAQISKAIQELKKSSYRPKMSILGSRKQYCIHPDISHSSNLEYEWYN